jgi:hypothetical protein
VQPVEPQSERSGPAAAFLRKHGWSLKAYLLALAFFPPMAVIIALKNPVAPMRWRLIGVVPPILFIALTLLGGTALIAKLFAWIVRLSGQAG